MFEIKLKVCADGTLKPIDVDRIRLGTQDEKSRVRLSFDIDNSVEGAYQYVKLYHPKATLLQRVTSNKVILSQNIFRFSGVWLLSFVSSDAVVTSTSASGSYIYISEPIEATVNDGILGYVIPSEEEIELNELKASVGKMIGMSYSDIVIPDFATRIGDYYLYNSHQSAGRIHIGSGVQFIGKYAFYLVSCNNLSFAEDSNLSTLDDYAFSHLNPSIDAEITIPRKVSSYGKNVFETSAFKTLRFGESSCIYGFLANSFYSLNIKNIYLPDRLLSFAAANNGYILRKSTTEMLWIPNTLTSPIPAQSIYECDNLSDIQLQSGFNVSANFSNCSALTAKSMVAMLNALRNLVGSTAKSLTLGATNLAKLTAEQKAIATAKNWTLA